jgi:hypothetical protein
MKPPTVTVYLGNERLVSSEVCATFVEEELYMRCLPAIEKYAAEARMIVTESINEDES